MAPWQVAAADAELFSRTGAASGSCFPRLDQERAQHPALIGDAKFWTYGALAGIVNGAAMKFMTHGLRLGDRVMVVSEISPGACRSHPGNIGARYVISGWSIRANRRG